MIDRLQDLNFLHLFYFWVVVRHGSISTACEHLHLTQPTISTQIRKLEKSLGHQLFDRSGRGLSLTDVGTNVFEYADDIFSSGRELLGSLRGMPSDRSLRLNVGVPMYLPKLITYRLLEVVLRMPEPVRIHCQEAPLDELVSDLVRHRHDVILSDMPIPSNSRIRSFNHPLGDCAVAFCAVAPLAKEYGPNFPESLDKAPLLLPSANTELRRSLDRWFDEQEFTPRVVAEFDDSALLKEFGSGGAGVFPIPAAVLPDVKRQYGVESLGILESVRCRFYAITAQRKLIHPAVVAISESATHELLNIPGEDDADGNQPVSAISSADDGSAS